VNELADFAARLAGIPVVVVCDSDWSHNAQVRAQAFAVVKVLQTAGVPAIASAPPEGRDLGWQHTVTGQRMRAKLGVDDYLGGGGRPGDMPAVEIIGVRGLRELQTRLRNKFKRPTAEAMTGVAGDLAMMATAENVAEVRSGEMAERLGIPRQSVTRYVNHLEAVGEVELIREEERRRAANGLWYTQARQVRIRGDFQAETREWRVADWLAQEGAPI
jgi:hypothetical protein